MNASEHPYSIARRAVRRAMAYQTPDYAHVPGKPEWYREQTGRKVWVRSHIGITDVTKRLVGILDEMGVTSRKLRGAVRAQLPAAYASVTAERSPAPVLTAAQRAERRVLERAFRLSWQAPAGAELKHFGIVERRKDATRMALIDGSWWHEYSRRHGSRKHEVAVLTGYEDGQWWARRVPFACATIDEALAYVRPAEVNAALAEGREVRRQGDVWLVRLKGGRSNLDALRGTDHRLEGSRLVHPQHGAVDLGEGAWKAHLSKDTTRPMRASAKFD